MWLPYTDLVSYFDITIGINKYQKLCTCSNMWFKQIASLLDLVQPPIHPMLWNQQQYIQFNQVKLPYAPVLDFFSIKHAVVQTVLSDMLVTRDRFVPAVCYSKRNVVCGTMDNKWAEVDHSNESLRRKSRALSSDGNNSSG